MMRSWSPFERLTILLLALAMLLCIPGCGGRHARQRQDLADARAGLEAMSLLVDQLASNPLVKPYVDALKKISAGAQSYVAAAAQGEALPAPTTEPAAIVGDPAAYKGKGDSSAATAPHGSGWWTAITAVALVGLGLVRRYATPIQPLFGMAAGFLHDLLADSATKEAKATAADHAIVVDGLIAELQLLPVSERAHIIESLPRATAAYVSSILYPPPSG